MMNTVYEASTVVIPLIFAIVFHEVAHGLMARYLGDPTASELGRLSLNPLRHVDPFGTIIFPGALYLAGMPVLGRAKTVPVDYSRLRHPKRDMALVGAAGPAANFLFAVASAVVIGLLVRVIGPQGVPEPAVTFLFDNLKNFILFNIYLGMFNLLPLPPLDGSRILRGIVPDSGARVLDRIEPYGFIVLVTIIVLVPQVAPSLHLVARVIMPPINWAMNCLGGLVMLVGGV